MILFIAITAIVLAYCLGSLSFAVIVSRLMHLDDPRTFGSGNPGATNVLRSGKKTAALLTLIGDGAKGWFAIWLAFTLLPPYLPIGTQSLIIFAIALAVMIGHLYPLFFGFHGGKGVATACGIMLALHPYLGLSVLTVWLIIATVLRISSLAAVVAAISAPFFALYWLTDKTYIAAVFIVAILVLRRHKRNILDLLKGKETKIGQANNPPSEH